MVRTKPNDSPSQGKAAPKSSTVATSSSSGAPGENNFKFYDTDNTGVPTVENNVGSYVRSIYLRPEWKGKEIFIHFGSVTSNLYLWINGTFVGYSEDSKLDAEFNITKYLKEGENKIAFQVFRWSDGSWLEDQDFFRLSGVARGIYLYARTQVHMEDLFIKTNLDSQYKNATLTIDGSMRG
ncbi:MAG: hypothetical protein RR286_06020 [Mucinivorans sp.]